MIDTTDGIIEMRPQLLQAVTAAKASDPKAKGSEFWRRVKTPYGGFKATFVVAANTMRTGPVSPMSLLKGHNLVGTNNATALMVGLMPFVHRRFKVPFTKADREFYMQQGFELKRLDINGAFPLSSQAEVVETLQYIRERLLIDGFAVTVHEELTGIETIYVGKQQDGAADKFYNKYLEMIRKPIKGKPAYWRQLLQFALNLLRYERVYRGAELRKMGKSNSNDWSLSVVRQELSDRLQQLGLSHLNLVAGLPASVLATLSPQNKAIYSAWASGTIIQDHWPRLTFNRYRKVFLPHGLDIAWPHSRVNTAVTLANRIQPTKLKTGYPKQFASLGAIYP
jgi:II/X family phage/plasmid replication protein